MIVVIVVALSVIVQGSLVPRLASTLRIPMRIVQPEPRPVSRSVRLRERPDSVHRLTVGPGSVADGRGVDDLRGLPESAWISVVVCHGRLVPVNRSTTLRAGDQIIVLADPELTDQLSDLFEATSGG